MIPFPRYIRLTFAFSLALLFISFLLWCVFPAERPLSAGYMLGGLISVLNGAILAVKTVKVGEYALGQSKKMQGTGLIQRFLLAGFAGFVTVRYPDLFHWAFVILGLSSVTAISLLVALLYHLTHGKG